jgi:hypothetical protein
MTKLLLVILLVFLLVNTVMALPTRGDLETMDYVYQGQPFVEFPAKDSIDLQTMDYSFQGQPFVRVVGGGAPPTGWPHKWNTLTIGKWNNTVFTKWNNL